MTWKTPITLLVLLVLLLGAAFYGWQTIISPATDDKAGGGHHGKKCKDTQQFKPGQLIKSSDLVVNVYNAGSIANLAGDTLDDLQARGFQTGVADNAPSGVGASNVTILTPSKNAPQAKLVAMQFKGPVQFEKGPALDPGIDVIVGDQFKGIDAAAKKFLKVQHDVSTCASVGKTAAS